MPSMSSAKAYRRPHDPVESSTRDCAKLPTVQADLSASSITSRRQHMNEPSIRKPSRRLLQNHDTLIVWVQRLLNTVVMVALLVYLAKFKEGEVYPYYRFLAIVAALLMLVVYEYTGVYRRFAGRIEGVQNLARSWGVVLMILGVVAFVTKTSEDFSRQVVLLWAMGTFVCQAATYIVTLEIYRRLHTRVAQRIPGLVLGTGPLARHLVVSIQRNPWLPDDIKGVLSEHAGDNKHWDVEQVPILDTTARLLDVVREHGIRRIYVALPLRLTYQLETLHGMLFNQNVDIIWAPDIFSLNLLNHSVREVAGVPLITLSESPLISGGRAFLKTVMDRLLGALALIALSPLMIAVAIAIKLDSRGPVLFRQMRHGWDGRQFQVYKFRSMQVHEESEGAVTQATRHDARITRVGRFIRKTSLDELPQLFNVLQGTMSLVGPRPHAISHNEYYSEIVNAYLARHRIKPGMTGLAQINGYRGETDTLEKMQKRVEYDLEYINQWSPWLDVKILFLTPFKLLSGNAY
jgi:putative colanic acid biosysnthesis UDP-glucose lipid carrier transferase